MPLRKTPKQIYFRGNYRLSVAQHCHILTCGLTLYVNKYKCLSLVNFSMGINKVVYRSIDPSINPSILAKENTRFIVYLFYCLYQASTYTFFNFISCQYIDFTHWALKPD